MVKTVHHSMARMVTKIDKIYIITFLRTARIVMIMNKMIDIIRIRIMIGWSLEWVDVRKVRMCDFNISIVIIRFKYGLDSP